MWERERETTLKSSIPLLERKNIAQEIFLSVQVQQLSLDIWTQDFFGLLTTWVDSWKRSSTDDLWSFAFESLGDEGDGWDQTEDFSQ